LTVISSPILTRIYSPSSFGALAVYNSIITVAITIAALRYEQAIVLSEDNNEAYLLKLISTCFVLITTLISSIAIFFIGNLLVLKLKVPELSSLRWIIPFGIFIFALITVTTQLYIKNGQFRKLALGRIIQSSVTVLTQLCLGAYRSYAGGLLFGSLLGGLANLVLLTANYKLYKEKNKSIIRKKISHLKSLLWKYRDFPLYSLPSALLDAFSFQIPILLLTIFYSQEVSGYYSLTDRVMRMPLALIGGSVAQVFYNSLSNCKNNLVEARKLIINTWKHLFLIGIFPFLIILFFGEDIFKFVFGKNWGYSGKMAEIMSLMYLAVFVSSPVSSVFTVFGKQKFSVFFGIWSVTGRSFPFFLFKNDLFLALLVLVSQEIIQIVIYCLLSLKFTKKENVHDLDVLPK
jgi:lipopolysaccharide exporter